MQRETLVLREGLDWAEIRPLPNGLGEVLHGTLHAEGDTVEHPATSTWTQAAELKENLDTIVSPLELKVVHDAFDEALLLEMDESLGEGGPGGLFTDDPSTGVLEGWLYGPDLARDLLAALHARKESAMKDRRRQIRRQRRAA